MAGQHHVCVVHDDGVDAAEAADGARQPAELVLAVCARVARVRAQGGERQVFDAVWSGEGDDVDAVIAAKGLKQMNDAGALEAIAAEVVAKNPKSVEEFRAGKDKAFNALVGQMMKATQGKANPGQAGEILRRLLGA